MNYNPYAAPSAGPGGPDFGQQQQQAGTNEPQAWGPMEVTQTGWDRLKPHWLMLSLMVFVMMIIQQIATQIPQGILKVAVDDPETQAIVGAFASLLILPLTVFLNAGLRKACLSVARGGAPNFGDLFGAGRAVPALLVYEFLPTIFVALVAGAGAAAVLLNARHSDDPSVIFIAVGATVLLLAPLVIAYALILWPFPYLVIDRNLSIGEAFREAARISKGSRLNFFLLGIVSFFVAMIGTCACGIGIFPATALITLASTIAYLRAAGQDSYNPGMGFYPPDMGGFGGGGYGAPPAGGFGAPPGGGFGAPPAGGFGGPPQGGGYGGPPGGGGYGPPGGGFGGPPPQGGGYGGPQGGGYGGPPPQGGGYGGPPGGGGYGGPPGGGY
jgi:hypothetical protein